MKRHILGAAIALLLPLCGEAQQAENHNSAISRNLELFNDIYKQLDLFYVDTLSADTVIQWGIRSMLRQVDPFTDYYPQNDEELRQMATGKYAGIGSIIRHSKKHDRPVVSEPYEGSPSQKAGVRAGDIIMAVDGRDVKGTALGKVTEQLRGEAGTSFELTVQRPGEDSLRHFQITRENIQLPAVPYYGMLQPGVGYIYLTSFTAGCYRDVRDAFLDLRKQGAERLVFDLRDNPGGSLEEAVDITNIFVPKGRKVVYTKGKLKSSCRDFSTAQEPIDTLMPMVVLVDGGSASAAEIFSGSLQDMDRAVIMGARTYGKGLVQTVRDVPYGGNLKLTTSRYHIPSGRCIQAYDYRHLNADGSVGVVPDSLTHLFHTLGGRPVRDGGGIKPDVEIKPDSLPSFIYELTASEVFMDHTTHYVQQHPTIAPAGEFSLTDEEYESFVKFVEDSGFSYGRRSDEVLKMLRSVAKREGYLEGAEAEFKALEAKFSSDVRSDLLRFRKKIEPYICDDIVRSYYYQRGGVQQQLVGDPCIERAKELLGNLDEYRSILHPDTK